ncbi:MAG: hypothetical protein ACJAYX_004350 [Planctomycetota bacterium]|jgi:hypothetical protein
MVVRRGLSRVSSLETRVIKGQRHDRALPNLGLASLDDQLRCGVLSVYIV